MTNVPESYLHDHECRRCGTAIECNLAGCDADGPTTLPVWEGDNIGCPNERNEDLDELHALQGM